MASPRLGVVMFLGFTLVATSALASFQASDLIYVPVVAHTVGSGDNVWRTEFVVTNTDEVAIDVAIAYLPSGGSSNSFILADRTLLLGGREDDDFGFVNEQLAGIPPNGTARIDDIVGEYWFDQVGLGGLGGLIVWAYEADTLEPDSSRVHRNAVVNTRTYHDTTVFLPDPSTHDDFVEFPATYGQEIPGVPWYNLADPAAVSEEGDLSFMILTGGKETEDFRFNVGVLNASDPQTIISLVLQPFQSNGEPFLDADENEITRTINLSTLAHVQWFRIFPILFEIDEDVEDAMVKVSFVSWSSTSPDPRPAFVVYGSVIDDQTNDPTTVMGAFGDPYDVECIWSGGDGGVKSGRLATWNRAVDSHRTSRRFADIPPS